MVQIGVNLNKNKRKKIASYHNNSTYTHYNTVVQTKRRGQKKKGAQKNTK